MDTGEGRAENILAPYQHLPEHFNRLLFFSYCEHLPTLTYLEVMQQGLGRVFCPTASRTSSTGMAHPLLLIQHVRLASWQFTWQSRVFEPASPGWPWHAAQTSSSGRRAS